MIYSSKIDKLYIKDREWKAFDPNSTEEQVYSVGKATEIPSVFGVRGAGSITNARGEKATFPGRKLTNSEFQILQPGAIDGDPMIIQVTATDGSSTTTYKIKLSHEKNAVNRGVFWRYYFFYAIDVKPHITCMLAGHSSSSTQNSLILFFE